MAECKVSHLFCSETVNFDSRKRHKVLARSNSPLYKSWHLITVIMFYEHVFDEIKMGSGLPQ